MTPNDRKRTDLRKNQNIKGIQNSHFVTQNPIYPTPPDQIGEIHKPHPLITDITRAVTIKEPRPGSTMTTHDSTDINPHTTKANPINEGNKLPLVLLSNIQSFGSTAHTDKLTEIESVLNINNIDVACLTETWLSENSKHQILLGNYLSYHSVRKKHTKVFRGHFHTSQK